MPHVRVADPTTCHHCGRSLTRGEAGWVDGRGQATCVDCSSTPSPPSPPPLPVRRPRLSRRWRPTEVVDLTSAEPHPSDVVPDPVAWSADGAAVDEPDLASPVVADQPAVADQPVVVDQPDDDLTLPDPGGRLARGSDRRDRSLTAADLPPVAAGRPAGSLAARPRRRRGVHPEQTTT